MKSYSNTKVIERNRKIGQYTSIGAFVILGIGFYITIKLPEELTFSFGALLLGFFLSQVGMYFTNRWGRTPRPDQLIEQGLKGLGREFTIYHYLLPAAHLLVGPAGIWALLPYQQAGTISYEKNRWKLRGGGAIQSYMRFFGGEGLGRPELDAGSEIETMQRYFQRKLPEGSPQPEINAALLFVHPKVELQANDSPIPAMKPKEFKEFLKTITREESISPLLLDAVRNILPAPQQDE
jgi:hypothetical protein